MIIPMIMAWHGMAWCGMSLAVVDNWSCLVLLWQSSSCCCWQDSILSFTMFRWDHICIFVLYTTNVIAHCWVVGDVRNSFHGYFHGHVNKVSLLFASDVFQYQVGRYSGSGWSASFLTSLSHTVMPPHMGRPQRLSSHLVLFAHFLTALLRCWAFLWKCCCARSLDLGLFKKHF